MRERRCHDRSSLTRSSISQSVIDLVYRHDISRILRWAIQTYVELGTGALALNSTLTTKCPRSDDSVTLDHCTTPLPNPSCLAFKLRCYASYITAEIKRMITFDPFVARVTARLDKKLAFVARDRCARAIRRCFVATLSIIRQVELNV